MTESLHVLLVEDSPTDAKLVIQGLRGIGRPVDFERVETADAMRAALGRGGWDLVISDWSMPSFSAPAALATLRETGLDLPFIIVSGTIGEDAAVEAMRAGAHDYVLKDKLVRLAPAVERELRECDGRTMRREAEKALRKSQARFQRLTDSGIIGIVIADRNGMILDANGAYLSMIGYSRQEALDGRLRWQDLTSQELAPLAVQTVDHLSSRQATGPWEIESLCKNGSRIPLLVGVANLDDPECIAFVLDLTKRRQAEDSARKEHLARERAEEALRQSEEQLRQAQKMEAVGRLAGGVAHDFNNILSVIISYADVVHEELMAGDPMRADVNEICKAAAKAAGLTRQLLMFSRQQVIEPKVIDLGDALASMHTMLGRMLGEDIDLKMTPHGAGRVKVDPSHIEQVIMNLVVNARDAMPTGGKLTIETDNVELDEGHAAMHVPSKPGPHVMLAVTDTGTGMDRETQLRIFEPFFTTKGVGKGTGLGLSTVFGIVQQSGGSIWVYSEPGKGTTFKIYLPRVEAEVDSLKPRAGAASPRGRETILLVEDEEQVRTLVLNLLQRQGYRVLPARSPAEAILIAQTHAEVIHLLLTDVVMPQMSGPELARRLAPARQGMRVLCMSGYTDDSIVRHGVLSSEMAYLQKPITPQTLGMKVREVLDAPLATQPGPREQISPA